MKTGLLFFLSVLILSFTTPALYARQQTTDDAGLWVWLSVSPKIYDGKWETLYSIEYRSEGDFSRTSLWSVAANVDYIVNPHIKIGAGYEFFLNRNVDGSFSPEHRYYPEAIASYSFGAFSASFRSRIMNTFIRLNEPHWEGRNRLKAVYAIGRTGLQPFVAVEPYHAIYPAEQPRFRKIRFYAGASCAIASRQAVSLYYMREDYRYKSFVRNVIQLEYTYAF